MKFQILNQTGKARSGIYNCASYKLTTPAFFCPTSRGVVPHLTPDNVNRLAGHHGSGTFIAGEDFMDKIDSAKQLPLMTTGMTGRDLFCLPADQPFIMSTRRSSPVNIQQPNTDRSVSIHTSEGVKYMPVDVYYKFAQQLKPDVLVAAPDLPHRSPRGLPGGNRARKMAVRTERWLAEALNLRDEMDIFAVMVPAVNKLTQREYLDYLASKRDQIAGLSFWELEDSVHENPKKLITPALELVSELQMDALPRFMTIDCVTPHQILDLVGRGFDMFQGNIVTKFTDLGLALDFTFPVEQGASHVWGRDMWEDQYVTEMTSLGETVASPVQYYRAYVNHLLKAREMSAWVILQMHNMHVFDLFFKGIQKSIQESTFASDLENFILHYGTSDQLVAQLAVIDKKNVGPTVRPHTSRF